MNRDLVKGLAIGVGVGLVAPMVFPSVARAMRPTMGAAIRAGVSAWERGREQLAEWGEMAEDMIAEARAAGQAGEPPMPAAATQPPGGNGGVHGG
ncbi:MAG: twin-arginine translocation signal domain-containing protein [Actinomycetota bacterium]